jgi:hypothetical protein
MVIEFLLSVHTLINMPIITNRIRAAYIASTSIPDASSVRKAITAPRIW